MATDGFEHDLSALHEFVVYRSLQDWRDAAEDLASDTQTEQERQEHSEHVERLEHFIGEAFEDEDFLNVEIFANAALQGKNLLDEFGVAIEHYVQLMPADIARRIEQVLGP